MKKNKIGILLVLMLFIGVCGLLYPSVSQYWNTKTQTKAVENYLEILDLRNWDFTNTQTGAVATWGCSKLRKIILNNDSVKNYLEFLATDDVPTSVVVFENKPFTGSIDELEAALTTRNISLQRVTSQEIARYKLDKALGNKMPTFDTNFMNYIVTDEPMIKTSTNKVKRNEELKLIMEQK